MTNHPVDDARYNQALIALHWLMLLLIAAVYASIELRELFPRGSEAREAMKAWHFTLGLSVFALVLVRLAIRLATPTPPISPPLTDWQRAGAMAAHLALYALMIAMPLGGWLILSGEGKSIPFWFGLEFPPLMSENKGLADTIEDLHETVGKAGYALIAFHAAAALAHHYIRRDNTFRRMLPGSWGR